MKTRTLLGQNMSSVLCRTLLYCVLSAIALFAIGLGLELATDGIDDMAAQVTLEQVMESLRTIGAEGLIGLGVIVIIITPLIRLLTTTVLAITSKEFAIAVLTLLSLASIILAFFVEASV